MRGAVLPPFLLAAALLALVLACGDGGRSSPSAARPEGRVTVFAAASLKDAFDELAGAFEEVNPGTRVVFNFGGSPTLRTQLELGARADVFASADQKQMDLALARGVVASAGQVFACNSLVLITPKENPGRVSSLADLRRKGLKLVLAHPDVPVGAYARRLLAALDRDPAYGAGFSEAVLANAVSLESNVKQVVAKVELGEADAGVVYGTDVTPSVAPNLTRIEIPGRFNLVAEYPIALTKEASNRRAAQAFIDFVLSPAGQAVLAKYGFLPS